MARKNYTAEQIIGMLRKAEVRLSQGEKTGSLCSGLGISEQSYYRWRREYGGLKVWSTGAYPVGQWRGVYGHRGARMAWSDRREDTLHRAGIPLGEWLQ